MKLVNFHIPFPHFHRHHRIGRSIGIQHAIEHLLDDTGHARQADIVAFLLLMLDNNEAAFCHVFGIIADALQNGSNFQRHNHPPQIALFRASARNQLNRFFVNIKFKHIKLPVIVDNQMNIAFVASLQRLDRTGKLRFGKPPQSRNHQI